LKWFEKANERIGTILQKVAPRLERSLPTSRQALLFLAFFEAKIKSGSGRRNGCPN